MFLLNTSILSSVLALPPASYSVIRLHSCPVCEGQYNYDFTIAVQLALDNLEWRNGSTLPSVNGNGTGGDRSHSDNTLEPDVSLPAIQAIPLQVGLNTSGWASLLHEPLLTLYLINVFDAMA